jgi:hypothetical protein
MRRQIKVECRPLQGRVKNFRKLAGNAIRQAPNGRHGTAFLLAIRAAAFYSISAVNQTHVDYGHHLQLPQLRTGT